MTPIQNPSIPTLSFFRLCDTDSLVFSFVNSFVCVNCGIKLRAIDHEPSAGEDPVGCRLLECWLHQYNAGGGGVGDKFESVTKSVLRTTFAPGFESAPGLPGSVAGTEDELATRIGAMRSEPGDATNGVTIDAAMTGEPDKSQTVTDHPFLSFPGCSLSLPNELSHFLQPLVSDGKDLL
ncbi:hypothetical protein L2E82_44797 [Cichorium intybus]|uniref:Uncharacterized protein n=1 Tax=Cichorium intybus TaxID=13427 RepID=A0ACB8ZR36_CICIN|nr:hypothetical protein L2E82_44797 [Cichorium intybus]